MGFSRKIISKIIINDSTLLAAAEVIDKEYRYYDAAARTLAA